MTNHHPADTPQIEHPAAEFHGADDLVKRLRDSSGQLDGLCEDAADRIEQQAKRIGELEAKRESFYMDYRRKCDEETKQLEAELAAIKSVWMEPVAIVAFDHIGWRHMVDALRGLSDGDGLYTAAQLAKVQAERDEAINASLINLNRVQELSAQIALAREALERLALPIAFELPRMLDPIHDAELLARMAYAREALSTLTTGNAVQAIEARAYERAAQECERLWKEEADAAVAGTQEPKYHDAIECAYAIRKLAEQKEL